MKSLCESTSHHCGQCGHSKGRGNSQDCGKGDQAQNSGSQISQRRRRRRMFFVQPVIMKKAHYSQDQKVMSL